MRIRISILTAALILFAALISNARAARFDDALEDALRAASPSEYLDIYVTMADSVDLQALADEMDAAKMNRARRHYTVVTELQDKAAQTQGPLLSNLAAASSAVRSVRPFWIANAVAVRAKPAFIETLRRRTDVRNVYLDVPLELIEPVAESGPISADAALGVTGGVEMTRAPELWAMGIDGTGTLACDQDTGADGTHAAFADRWRGLDALVDPSEAWFDPNGHETFPTDSGNHGTHTLGTILGDDHMGHRVGMAPGAKWIGAKTIDIIGGSIYSDAVAAFQWMADPDGNPATTDDVPDAVNNSWGIPISFCGSDFYDSIDAAEAAGVVVLFAAGNEGPFRQTIRNPANRITTAFNTFSIGALKQNGTTITSFSSRGPSSCDHATIKPEISAIGQDVLSSLPGDQYGKMDGTSMATPHVTGAVLLLRQAFPEATVEEIKMALYESAVDLGDAGEDNVFGMGRMDVVAAFWWLTAYMVDSDGSIRIDNSLYGCGQEIAINVSDEDLEGSGTVQVTIVSGTETTPENVTLTENQEFEGIFEGSIATAPGAPAHDGVLQVADGDAITVTYVDANDGAGHLNVSKTATATVDCAPPDFAGLTGASAGDWQVELTWDPSSEEGTATYNIYRADSSGGQDFDNPTYQASSSPFIDKDAENGVEWFYVVRVMDQSDNEDDNTVEFSAAPAGAARIFWDDFDFYPDGIGNWTVVDGGYGEGTWTDENPANRTSDFLTEKFAVVDRNGSGDFAKMDESLVTPALDCSHFEDVTITFTHSYSTALFQHASLDWSYDGANWTEIHKWLQSTEAAETFTVPDADLHEQVFLRFHYTANFMSSEYWGVDNVIVTGTPSTAPSITTTTTTTTTASSTTTTIPADDDTADDTEDDDTADDTVDDTSDDSADDSSDDVADDASDDTGPAAGGSGDDDDDDGGCCG